MEAVGQHHGRDQRFPDLVDIALYGTDDEYARHLGGLVACQKGRLQQSHSVLHCIGSNDDLGQKILPHLELFSHDRHHMGMAFFVGQPQPLCYKVEPMHEPRPGSLDKVQLNKWIPYGQLDQSIDIGK
jgi:hypothetical protein